MSEDESSELLEKASASTESDSDEERCGDWLWWLLYFLMDLAFSVPFWWVMFYWVPTDPVLYGSLGTLLVLMILWRVYRAYCEEKTDLGSKIPYTCAHVHADGRDLFLVATVHISPRAPKDVWKVIRTTKPNVAMIELDEERLNRMRSTPRAGNSQQVADSTATEQAMFQPVIFRAPAAGAFREVEISALACRGIWNSQAAGEHVSGDVIFDHFGFNLGDPYDTVADSFMVMIRRPPPEMLEGMFAPFTNKAYKAANSGASALLVVNCEDELPPSRIGMNSVYDEMKHYCITGNCHYPSVPLLMLRHSDGERVIQLCQSGRRVTMDFTVKDDEVRARSLPKKLCQECALIFSGIGVLYGIIQCFSVKVGAEFLAAYVAARDFKIPCVCIDVDLDHFWSKLGWAVLPTPCNLLNSLLSWIAFPRIFFQFLFPPFGRVDSLGSAFLHLSSFSCRIWVSFILAGLCASLITNGVLQLFSTGIATGGEAVHVVKHEDRTQVQTNIILAIEMYMLPQIYHAVAASRDESMYQSMVHKIQSFAAERVVVVVGAGHANGILQRVGQSGL